MIVICLEGCHGSGKTQLCTQFQKAGFNVLDEAFLDMPTFPLLHPQSLVMESIWVTNWLQRILKMQVEQSERGKALLPHDQIFIADRSPFSAVFYAQNGGHLLEPLIAQQVKDLYKLAGIQIITVYLKVEKFLLWERIQDRLKKEPERKKYNEDSREWMETTVNFYENRNWDITLDNNYNSLPEVMKSLIGYLASRYSRFPTYLPNSPTSASLNPPIAVALTAPLH